MLNKEQYEFIEMHFDMMYRNLISYAMCSLNDISLSEEAVQDTFRIACSKIDLVYTSENPKGWLVNTLRNFIRNIHKSRRVLNKYFVSVMDLEEIEDSKNYADYGFELIFGDIAKSEDFKLLIKIVLDKCTMLEAANEFGITVDACKKRVQRIKKKLKEEYQRDI